MTPRRPGLVLLWIAGSGDARKATPLKITTELGIARYRRERAQGETRDLRLNWRRGDAARGSVPPPRPRHACGEPEPCATPREFSFRALVFSAGRSCAVLHRPG